MTYYKNPMNYHGAKNKLLSKLYSFFPTDCERIVDLFGGSGEVSLNSSFSKVLYNEKLKVVGDILRNLDKDFLEKVDSLIAQFHLTKTSKEEFYIFRNWYNENRHHFNERENAIAVYTLITHSFNNQFAFNREGNFNMAAGTNRSYFNPSMRKKAQDYINLISQKEIEWHSEDFSTIKPQLTDFVYCDPPYLITTGAYERNFSTVWSEDKEKELLSYLKDLDKKGIKWGLSNVLYHKGKTNTLLKEWVEENNFKVEFLSMDYSNCNYQLKEEEKNTKTIEVYIHN